MNESNNVRFLSQSISSFDELLKRIGWGYEIDGDLLRNIWDKLVLA